MNTPHVNSNQVPPLSLFEDVFEPFISQSRNIIIQYQLQFECPLEDCANDIMRCSVNGCLSPDDFMKKLTAMNDISVQVVYESLQQVHHSFWQPHIEHIQNQLQTLNSIVVEEPITYNNVVSKLPQTHHFKTFSKPRLEGTKKEYSLKCGQWIRLNVEEFAEVWLKVITNTISRFDLIYDLLKKTLDPDAISINQIPFTKKRLNLTVPQIGYYLHLMVVSGILEVPPNKGTESIKWFVVNFQSKNQINLQPASLRNKFSSPDLDAADFWEKKIKSWLSVIQEDKERLSK